RQGRGRRRRAEVRAGTSGRRDGCHWRRVCAAATLARMDQARRPLVRRRRRIARAARDAVHARRRRCLERRDPFRNRSAVSEPRRAAEALHALNGATKNKEMYTMRKFLQVSVLAAACAATWTSSQAEDLMQIYQQARQADPTLAIA